MFRTQAKRTKKNTHPQKWAEQMMKFTVHTTDMLASDHYIRSVSIWLGSQSHRPSVDKTEDSWFVHHIPVESQTNQIGFWHKLLTLGWKNVFISWNWVVGWAYPELGSLGLFVWSFFSSEFVSVCVSCVSEWRLRPPVTWTSAAFLWTRRPVL